MAALLVLLLGALYFLLKLPLLRQLIDSVARWACSRAGLGTLVSALGGPAAQSGDCAEIMRAAVLVVAVPLVALAALLDPFGPSRWVSACAVVGVGLLLTSPANDVVAALLSLVRRWDYEPQGGQADGGRAPAELLGGGRWIGSLERLLMLLLALSSAPAGIGAVVAAKGVIRFPEISADTPDPKDAGAQGESGRLGTKAEEFLIGSFSSWLLALLGYLLLRSAGVGR